MDNSVEVLRKMWIDVFSGQSPINDTGVVLTGFMHGLMAMAESADRRMSFF